MHNLSQNVRIIVVAVCLALFAGVVITPLVGPFTVLRIIAHAAVVFSPMLVSVYWSLRPNASGWCAAWIRSLVRPAH